MLQFVMDAWADTESFESSVELPRDLLQCFAWMKGRSDEEANLCREAGVAAIEVDAKRLSASGRTASWLSGAPTHVRHICKDFNGPLFEKLLAICGHVDLIARISSVLELP